MHTWLFYTFISDGGNEYRVNINATIPTPSLDGLPKETLGGSNGFTLEYDGRSQEPFQAIVGSKVTVNLYFGTAKFNEGVASNVSERFVVQNLIDSLVGQPDGTFTIEIRRDPNGANTLYWCGVILSEQVVEDNAPLPRNLKLTAADDLANLFYVDYEDFPGAESFKNAIIKILQQTRVADYWNNTELFVSTQAFFTTESAQTAGSTQPYDYHRFLSNDMRKTRPNGTSGPRSAGEVLEAICDLWMASVYQSDGRWWFVPRIQGSFLPAAYTLQSYNKLGNSTTSGVPQVVLTQFFITSATPNKVLSGGTDSYLHPVLQVTKTYNFQGSIPLVTTGLLAPLADVLNEPYENDLFQALSGTRFTLSLFLRIVQPFNSTFTGAKRAIRYRLQFRLNVGAQYLNKINTPSGQPVGKSTCGGVFPGGVVSVFNPVAQGVGSSTGFQWDTDNTVRWVFWTPPIDARCGETLQQTWSFEPPNLPSDEAGFTWELEQCDAYDADGNTSSSLTTDALTSTEFLVGFNGWILEGGNVDAIGFEATNSNNARDILELNEALFGDQISSANTRGAIRLIDGTTYTTQEWIRPDSSTPLFINEQIVRAHAEFRHRARYTRRFTTYDKTRRFFWQRPNYTGLIYTFTSMRFDAALDEYDVECINIAVSGIIVLNSFTPNPSQPTGLNPAQIADQIASIAGSVLEATQQAEVGSGKVLTLQPEGVSGIVLKNLPTDTHKVTYTPAPVGVNKSVTMPFSFTQFVKVQTRLSVTTQRFASFVVLANYATIQPDSEMILPYDGRVLGLWIRSSASAVIVAGVYLNGLSLTGDTNSVTADVPSYYDFEADNAVFDAGDTLAVSIESDTQPTEVNVTVVLAAW